MQISYAGPSDLAYLTAADKHIPAGRIEACIRQRRILIARDTGEPIGLLRFGYLWDALPFMNLLWIDAGHRRKGIGTGLVRFWEDEMRAKNHTCVMTSTQSNETAQHFYRKLGYRDCGGFTLPAEPIEILFYKDL